MHIYIYIEREREIERWIDVRPFFGSARRPPKGEFVVLETIFGYRLVVLETIFGFRLVV